MAGWAGADPAGRRRHAGKVAMAPFAIAAARSDCSLSRLVAIGIVGRLDRCRHAAGNVIDRHRMSQGVVRC